MRMKRDERRAKQHALAHPINHRHRPSLSGKAQWPLLITGAGRSGTLFTAVFLNNLGMSLLLLATLLNLVGNIVLIILIIIIRHMIY